MKYELRVRRRDEAGNPLELRMGCGGVVVEMLGPTAIRLAVDQEGRRRTLVFPLETVWDIEIAAAVEPSGEPSLPTQAIQSPWMDAMKREWKRDGWAVLGEPLAEES